MHRAGLGQALHGTAPQAEAEVRQPAGERDLGVPAEVGAVKGVLLRGVGPLHLPQPVLGLVRVAALQAGEDKGRADADVVVLVAKARQRVERRLEMSVRGLTLSRPQAQFAQPGMAHEPQRRIVDRGQRGDHPVARCDRSLDVVLVLPDVGGHALRDADDQRLLIGAEFEQDRVIGRQHLRNRAQHRCGGAQRRVRRGRGQPPEGHEVAHAMRAVVHELAAAHNTAAARATSTYAGAGR